MKNTDTETEKQNEGDSPESAPEALAAMDVESITPEQLAELKERAVKAVLLLPNRRDGENRRHCSNDSKQRNRRAMTIALVVSPHAQVAIEFALDEAGQFCQTLFYRAEVPIRPAEKHPSRLKITIE